MITHRNLAPTLLLTGLLATGCSQEAPVPYVPQPPIATSPDTPQSPTPPSTEPPLVADKLYWDGAYFTVHGDPHDPSKQEEHFREYLPQEVVDASPTFWAIKEQLAAQYPDETLQDFGVKYFFEGPADAPKHDNKCAGFVMNASGMELYTDLSPDKCLRIDQEILAAIQNLNQEDLPPSPAASEFNA